jgi:hypothetical protein
MSCNDTWYTEIRHLSAKPYYGYTVDNENHLAIATQKDNHGTILPLENRTQIP